MPGFNPRTHAGCDQRNVIAIKLIPCFNPRTHAGCDATCRPIMLYLSLFQSTHPRGVRPCLKPVLVEVNGVSIHAPTRGATIISECNKYAETFQSTHPRGVRLFPIKDVAEKVRFNPRTHAGCDLAACKSMLDDCVSIHAPTRGATSYNALRTRAVLKFQSTHPRGVRPSSLSISKYLTSFNPRTHAGCDEVRAEIPFAILSFNPRTHAGCDILRLIKSTEPSGFNPRTHAGCDPNNSASFSIIIKFQSTHPRGVRPVLRLW